MPLECNDIFIIYTICLYIDLFLSSSFSIEAWHKNNLHRAQVQVEAYLQTLEAELRDAVIHACEFDFFERPGGDLVIAAAPPRRHRHVNAIWQKINSLK